MFGNFRGHEVEIAQALTPAIIEVQAAVQAHLVREIQAAGLRLCDAQELQQLEAEADAHWMQLAEQQESSDGSFEQTLTGIYALTRRPPHAYPVEQLRKHADLLAEVRTHLIGHWTSRLCIGISDRGMPDDR